MLLFGCFVKSVVSPKATTLMPAQTNITLSSPHEDAAGSNRLAPIRAPSLPPAALIPFKDDRQRWENSKLGKINVVVLGP
mmetsp:Transcript_30735/g.46602  ORF Transcript_30735/g.46602 Transcript_30735/m.46602 type:complete len:80 (-) Transcript_30735:1306-1545(-)